LRLAAEVVALCEHARRWLLGISGDGRGAAAGDTAGRGRLDVAGRRVVGVGLGVGGRDVDGVRLRGAPAHRQELVRLPGERDGHDHRPAHVRIRLSGRQMLPECPILLGNN